MKRFFSLLLLLLPAFVLAACQHEPPTVENLFTVTFTVRQNDLDFSGVLSREESSLGVTMSEPYTVQGMTFAYQDGGLSINYGDHSAKANCDYLPAGSIPAALYDTLAYLPQAAYTDTSDGEDSFTLPTPYGDAVLTARDGIPTSLYDPHSGLNFQFQTA